MIGNTSVVRAVGTGVVILIFGGFAMMIALGMRAHPNVRDLIGYSPLVAGLTTALLSSRLNIIWGTATGIISAVLGIFFELLYHSFGIPTDLPILEGFLLRLILNTGYAFGGAVVGCLLLIIYRSQQRRHASSMRPAA